MDYYSLTRKELQALCKKHAIPANLTNVSMAEALTALLNVNNNKPSDEGFQKQEAASEDMADESVPTEVSNTPRGSKSAEGQSAEEPILLDDEDTPYALKEKSLKNATKIPTGKGGDPTGKSRTRDQPGKILDDNELSNAIELSDAITPHPSVEMRRGRSCKSGRDAKNPKTRSHHAISSEDVKPLQEKHDSCKKEESDETNNESVEELPKERPKGRLRLSRKKVDKVEMATEESIQGPVGTNAEAVEEVLKTRPNPRSSRKKVNKVEEATEEIQGANDADDESVDVPKTRPKARPSRKRNDEVQEATEKSIGTDDPNDESVEEVPENRPKEMSSRKKVNEVEKATEEIIRETGNLYNESLEEVPENRPKGRSSRRKNVEVEGDTEESIQATDDANYESVKAHKTRSKWGRLSRKQIDDAEEETEESIQGEDYGIKGGLTPICRRSTRENALKGLDKQPLATRSSRRNASGVDSVNKIPGASKRISASSKGKVAAKVEDSSEKKVEHDPAETSVKIHAKKNMKTPVQTLRALRSSRKDSTNPNGDALEESAIRANQVSTCRRRNPIQNLHQLADLENKEELNYDLDCSDLKQDKVGNRRTARKETTKYQGKENKETLKGEVPEKVEASKEVESEEVKCGILVQQELKKCQNSDVKHMPCHTLAERTKQVQNESMAEISHKKSSECLQSPTSEKVDAISVCNGKSIMKQHTTDLLQEVKMNINAMPTDGIMTSTEQSVTEEIQESNFLKSKSDSLLTEGSALKNNSLTKDAQDSGALGIEAEEGWEKTVKEGVKIAERHSGFEPETVHEDLEVDENAAFYHGMDSRDIRQSPINAQEGKSHCIEDEESQEKTIQYDFVIAERTEPETMQLDSKADENAPFFHGTDSRNIAQIPTHALKGEAGIKHEESQGKAIQEGVGIAESHNGTEPETMHEDLEVTETAFSHGMDSKDEDNQEKAVRDGSQDGEDYCIEDEDSQERTVQDGLIITERTESETEDATSSHGMDSRNAAHILMHSHEVEVSGVKDEENQGKSTQEGMTIAESHIGAEPEIVHAHKVEARGIKDELSGGETIHEGVSISESHNPIETEIMRVDPHEGEVSSIKDENKVKSIEEGMTIAESHIGAEPEIVYAHKVEARGIKDEESGRETIQEDVSISESHNPTEPETMRVDLKFDEMTIAESHIGAESEIVHAHKVEACDIKDEESGGDSIQEGVSISESHNPTEPQTMRVDLKFDENAVFCYGMDSTCIEQSKEICRHDYELTNFTDMKELNYSRELLLSSTPFKAVNSVQDKAVLLDKESEMMVAQEMVIGELRPSEKECLYAKTVSSEDLRLVGKQPELQQCTSNIVDETINNTMEDNISFIIDEEHEEIQSELDSTEEDWSAKDSEDLVLSVMPNILDSQGREGTNFARIQSTEEDWSAKDSEDSVLSVLPNILDSQGRGGMKFAEIDSTEDWSAKDSEDSVLSVMPNILDSQGRGTNVAEIDSTEEDWSAKDSEDLVLSVMPNILASQGRGGTDFAEIDSTEDLVLSVMPNILDSQGRGVTNFAEIDSTEDLVLSVMPNILESQGRERTNFEKIEGQDMKAAGEVYNEEFCSDEGHVSFTECKEQIIVQDSTAAIDEEIQNDINSTEDEDPGAKDSEDSIFVSVMHNDEFCSDEGHVSFSECKEQITVQDNTEEIQNDVDNTEGMSFANLEGQDMKALSKVHNNEACSDELHIFFSECKRQSLVQKSPATPPMETEDGATEGKGQLHKISSYSKDIKDDEDVSEAATNVSMENGKVDTVVQTQTGIASSSAQVDNEVQKCVASSSAQIDSEVQTKTRVASLSAQVKKCVASSSAQIDSEVQPEKWVASSSAQIDSEVQTKTRVASLSPQVDNRAQTEKLVALSCAQIDCEVHTKTRAASSSSQIGSEVKIEKFNSELEGGQKESYPACICTDEERIESFSNHGETGSSKCTFAKEFIHCRVKQFVPEKEKNGTSDDCKKTTDTVEDEKLDEESASIEDFFSVTPPKEEKRILVPISVKQESSTVELEISEQNNTEVFENPVCLEDTHFHEKTCAPDEEVQVTGVDKLQNEVINNSLLIEKKKSPCLNDLSFQAKVPVSVKNTHFNEKTCDRYEEVQATCVNKLQNEAINNSFLIEKENCLSLNDLSLRKLRALLKKKKSNKDGKRSALNDLSNELEERAKVPGKTMVTKSDPK